MFLTCSGCCTCCNAVSAGSPHETVLFSQDVGLLDLFFLSYELARWKLEGRLSKSEDVSQEFIMTNVYRDRHGRILQLPSPLFLVLCNRRLVTAVTGICRAEASQWTWLPAAKPRKYFKGTWATQPHGLLQSPHKESSPCIFRFFWLDFLVNATLACKLCLECLRGDTTPLESDETATAYRRLTL